ncbi:hypothetical protein ASE08_28590 [Rhizobacter sp. Root16D2]|nr:hypothetical protein ASC88_16680 [Rhizobacter sp. Root29]KQW13766.1 hypothetical protein ASC98_16810 [Rhizobacter sp. Root1238]KRB12440.1 hypothetical protein ASE08_28590 [Rhizobacter sp. Root16D2]
MTMKLSRKNRILTALIALFSMLFMQAAVASYTCPGLPSGGDLDSMVVDAPSMAAMPGCDQPDAGNPALCHAHCVDGKSSLDKPQAPTVTPAVVLISTILFPLEPLLASPQPVAEQPPFLRRTTAPPIAIRHCCFRI